MLFREKEIRAFWRAERPGLEKLVAIGGAKMSNKSLRKLSRRTVLKGAAAVAATGPWIVSPKVLASSGEVNVLMWSRCAAAVRLWPH